MNLSSFSFDVVDVLAASIVMGVPSVTDKAQSRVHGICGLGMGCSGGGGECGLGMGCSGGGGKCGLGMGCGGR